MSTDMQQSPIPASRKACVACHELIHAEASTCRYCGAGQHPRLWDSVGTALKWIGGVTAVISLVLGASRINDLYSDWYERKITVSELTKAAALQSDANDYKGAWDLIEEALKLNPSSRIARQQQTAVAMAWLRGIRARGEQTFNDIVEKLLPTVYLGTVSDNSIISADAHAHLGWANYLRRRNGITGLEVDKFYDRALQLDPDNCYAHAMLGHWLLWSYQQDSISPADMAVVKSHFETALESNRNQKFVRKLQLAALIDKAHKSREVTLALLMAANEMRNQGEELSEDYRHRILEKLYDLFTYRLYDNPPISNLKPITEAIQPSTLLKLISWLDTGNRRWSHSNVAKARLQELAGNHKKALILYQKSIDERELPVYREYAKKAVTHLSKKPPDTK